MNTHFEEVGRELETNTNKKKLMLQLVKKTIPVGEIIAVNS